MRYLLQRLAQLIVVFVLVTFAILVVMRIGSDSPLDLARKMMGGSVTDAQAQATVARLHLDRNFVVQYGYWLRDLFVHGYLGYSQVNSQAVTTVLRPRVWTTVLLGLYANVFGLLVAIPVAVQQAYRRDSWLDKGASLFTFVAVGVPAIVLGVLLQLLFALHWKIFPFIGNKIMPWEDLGKHFKNFFLPTLTLTLPVAAVFARLLRSEMVLTLQSDFITLASAKGVSPQRVLWRHALRNSMFSLLTAVGTQLGALIGSAIVVERLFEMEGLGTQLVRSVLTLDLFTVQSLVAIIVIFVVLANLAVDLLYAVVDPRIRQARALA